ncbi:MULTISPECIES: BppU family phage baseplate upper protein [Staphylococcus]|uniref:BppU family phage baseplate upper protein n=1 Tax=Staphylococcus TaxID=1279 RepID=UPI00069E5F69|nr:MULTISPECIES: BppU family phage baseplate upper protein [Staphylococcus]OFO70704.1 hypothetical protein HMPREF3019_08200 [Staphylococcus sp. HMSC061H04]
MIIKDKSIEAYIRANNIDIGDIGSRFYTEDINTAIIKIKIFYNGQSVNLSETDMKPELDLFAEDGSIFLNEKVEVVSPNIGLIEYKLPERIIKHAGKMNCKLFLKNETQSIHVANFYFKIFDSGIEKAVAKEINLNLVESTVKQIMSEDLVNLLNDGFKDKLTGDLENYLSTHSEEFKGPKGDEGPQGLQGEQGLPGKDGSTISYTDTGWQLLSLINGTTQAGRLNLPEYRLVTINDTNLLFIRGAVTNITSRTMVFAKLPTNISQKIRSYAEYSKVKINSYTNTSSIYNITVITSGELKITFEPNSTVDASSPYYIEGTISL